MPNIISQVLEINWFKDLVVPAGAALGALALAMRKFRHERLWQEKYSAYRRVLESIEAIRYWGDEASSEVHMLPTVGWFDGKEAHQFYAEAKREVAKQTSIGTVLLSSEFVSALQEFQTELFRETFDAADEMHDDDQEAEFAFGQHAAKVRDIADKHLSTLIELARRDLKS